MCFSLVWIEQILIWAVIVIAVVAILKLLIPFILSQLGASGSVIMAAINIVVWAFVAIIVIYICFALIGCLLSSGHLAFPSPR